jgi:pimeloyl-ACP methyl ester carboxylesterase
MSSKVVLVHGAFHGAWCWEAIVKGLAERDIEAIAVELPGHGQSSLPLRDLRGDAEAVARVLRSCREPVVLCGHSYGGAVIGEAVEAAHDVAQLVYIAAVVPDVGESFASGVPEIFEAPIAASLLPGEAEGSFEVDPERAGEIFYHDCDAELVAWAVAQLGPQGFSNLEDCVSRAPWRERPSTYVICEDDRTLDVAAQRRAATRCTRALTWPTGHSPMLSRPELVVELLAEIAEGKRETLG